MKEWISISDAWPIVKRYPKFLDVVFTFLKENGESSWMSFSIEFGIKSNKDDIKLAFERIYIVIESKFISEKITHWKPYNKKDHYAD